MVYSIRSLKNGTGSVLIGASLVLLAMATPTISANETTTASAEATNTITQPLTDTADIAGKNESDFSSPNNANASLEKKKNNLQQRQPLLLQLPLIQHHKPDKIVQANQLLLLRLKLRQKSQSKTITSVSTSKNFLKKTRIVKDYGLGTMLKNLLKTGLTELCPLRMPKKMTTATT